MKKILFLIPFMIFQSVFSQSTEYVFVYFKDKPGYSSFLTNPLSELTQKALDRRNRLGIPLDIKDAPIESSYVEDVRTTLGLTKIKSQSKWLNGVAVEITPAQKNLLASKSYVASIETFAKRNSIIAKTPRENVPLTTAKNNKFGEEVPFFVESKTSSKTQKTTVNYNYGLANLQNTQVNLTPLHINGYTGNGIAVAILDTGFRYVDVGKAYSYLRDNGKIKDTYNFVGDETASVYNPIFFNSAHGANVLGIMAGYLNDPSNTNITNRYFVGAAPDADYYLYATEDDNGNDYPEEEINFLRGLERADKMGVDIATASLGYNTFGDPRYNYTYQDMNGNRTFVSRAAGIAADKGIFVLIALGNEGSSTWRYLTAPSDQEKVFSVGAVTSSGTSSSFSSYGPNANGSIKPDAVALGTATAYTNSYYINNETGVSQGSGTSYATPVAAGGVACLLQALPKEVSREMIKSKLRETASLYPSNNDRQGYGILNFSSALTEINKALGLINNPTHNKDIKIYPTLVSNELHIETTETILNLELYNEVGQKLKDISVSKIIPVESLSKGIYYLKVRTEQAVFVEKFIKE